MKRNLFTTLILLSLPLLLLCTTANSGIAQPLSRQEFKVQLLQAYTNDDLTRVRDLLKTQRLDAIRTIESVLDSSILKKTRGTTAAGNHDWETANALADIYAQEFGDRFYLEKAHRYKKFSSESTKIKAQILVLRKTARDSLLQGKYDLARNFYEQALELAQNIDDLDDLAAIPGSIGAAYFYLGDFDAALENYQKSLTALEEIGDKWRTGNRLGNIANVYSDWSDYPTARAYFERALPYRKELDDKRGMAADYNNTGLIHQEMGNYEKALANYQHALELNRTLENQRSIARNLANIANIQIELGDYGDAIAIYGEALPIRRELGDRQGEGNDLGNLGLAYLSLGDYNKALSHFQQALAIHQELGYQEGEAYQLGRLADLYKFRGEYPEAIRNYQRALEIHRDMGHVRGEAYWIEALGQTYMAVGDHARALENFSNAIELHRSIENVSGQASTLSTIGRTYLEMNELEKAEDAFGQALKFHKDLGEKNNECMDLGNLGYVYSLEDEPVKAIDTWKLAMNLAQGIGNRRLQGWLQLQQGDFYRELDSGKKAARAYEQGLAISEGLEDPELRWQLYLGRGKLWQDRGDDERAFYSFQAAVTTVEKIRAQAEVEEFKAGIIHNSFETYEAMVTLLVRMNRVEEAFEYVERARSRALLDRLGNTKIDSHDPTTQNLIVQERELRIKIQNLRSQIVEEEDDNKGLRGSESSYRHSIEKAQMDYQRLLLDIKLRHPEYNSLVSIDPFPVSTIQRLLTNKSALLEYFITEESTIIFVVTQENLQVFTVPEGKQSVRGKIALYRGTGVRNMNKGKLDERFWMMPLHRLYEILIAPVVEAGALSGKEHLIIVAHSLLHYLPFRALITQEIDSSKQPHYLI
ncbi:tetratricopeptide repeat protein [candidate division KSB1 bacterium]|nr:tetratricopeptide repeat protein [candidate division KSB1 bacterium]